MALTFKSSHGREVVAADTAENIGEVKALVVDSRATRVESVHVAGRGRKAEVIPWASIRSFGEDVVVAAVASSPEQVASDHETDAVKGKIVMVGARVLDTSGVEAGIVEDVMFDASSGKLTGALTTAGHIDASRFRAIGSYALIVDPERG